MKKYPNNFNGKSTKLLFFMTFSVHLSFFVLFTTTVFSQSTNGVPPVRILYDNDNTNMVQCKSPWRNYPILSYNGCTEDHSLTDENIIGSIAEVSGLGVHVGYKFGAGAFGRPTAWQKTTYSGTTPKENIDWFIRTYKPENKLIGALDWYAYNGGDCISTFLNTTQKYDDLMPFISIRMNDPHGLDYLDDEPGRVPGGVASCLNQFLYQHLNYFVGSCNSGWGKTGLDFAIQEVRERRLNIIRDLIYNYAPSGIELNFMRGLTYFQDELPVEKRKEIMTEFIKDIKRELDKSGNGRLLAIKIPTKIHQTENIQNCDKIGIDIAELNKIADMIIVSDVYHTKPIFSSDLAEIRHLAPDVWLYAELHYKWEGGGTSDYTFNCTREQLYQAAQWAYKNGADGISLFNFQYYRPYDGERELTGIKIGFEPYFDVIQRLANPDWLDRHLSEKIINKK